MRRRVYLTAGIVALGLIITVGGAIVVQPGGDGPAAEKVAKSRLIKVTVYPNNALVTREVEVPAGEGLAELVVSPLPVRVVDSSLYSEGTDELRVLSTRFRTRQVKETSREDVRKIEEELKSLKLAAEKLQSEISSREANLKLLDKLEGFTSVTTVNSTKDGGLNGDTVIKLSQYVMDERMDKSKTVVDLKQQLQANQEQADFLRRKLQETSAGTTKTDRDAVIVVDRIQNKGGKIRLNYLVDSVSWQPQYKLRAGKAGDGVELEYQAALVQQSGEDWGGVQLTLSTAQPSLNAVPPDLKKLEVTVVARADAGMPPTIPGGAPAQQPMPFEPGKSKGALQQDAKALRDQAWQYAKGKELSKNYQALNEAAAKEQELELMQSKADLLADANKLVVQSRIQDGPSVTYHLPHALSIPSRNDAQVVQITELDLTPNYYYKSIPILNANVYRLADLNNKSDYVLLPGEATMYQGTDFVGRMNMPLVAVGEEFTVGFGIDPQLQIQRKMIDKTKATQGGNQVLTYKYRILVSSYKKEMVNLQVWDRLPFAETETASISLVSATPEVSEEPIYVRESRPYNLLRWDLKVEPMTNGEKAAAINYEFKMELDREMFISKLLAR